MVAMSQACGREPMKSVERKVGYSQCRLMCTTLVPWGLNIGKHKPWAPLEGEWDNPTGPWRAVAPGCMSCTFRLWGLVGCGKLCQERSAWLPAGGVTPPNSPSQLWKSFSPGGSFSRGLLPKATLLLLALSILVSHLLIHDILRGLLWIEFYSTNRDPLTLLPSTQLSSKAIWELGAAETKRPVAPWSHFVTPTSSTHPQHLESTGRSGHCPRAMGPVSGEQWPPSLRCVACLKKPSLTVGPALCPAGAPVRPSSLSLWLLLETFLDSWFLALQTTFLLAPTLDLCFRFGHF